MAAEDLELIFAEAKDATVARLWALADQLRAGETQAVPVLKAEAEKATPGGRLAIGLNLGRDRIGKTQNNLRLSAKRVLNFLLASGRDSQSGH